MAKKQATSTPKNNPFQSVVQELPFHDFQKVKLYIGLYISTLTLGDKPENKFDVNIFSDAETGEQKFITNAYAINKAITEARLKYPENFSDVVFSIEFEGKTVVKGKPFNKFKIGVCTLEQYKASKE
jgi:hypothetical protein